MTILQTFLSILQSIGAIAANPVLGSIDAVTKIAPLIGLVSSLAAEGVAAQSKLEDLDNELKAIVATGNAPDDATWADWDARHQAAKARLQAP